LEFYAALFIGSSGPIEFVSEIEIFIWFKRTPRLDKLFALNPHLSRTSPVKIHPTLFYLDHQALHHKI